MSGTGSQGGGGDKRAGLIAVNDLGYVLDPDLSVAVNRTTKAHFFQNTEYKSGQHSICILNSGADYIDTRNSFLTFNVKIPERNGGSICWFGQNGSAMNLIESITISSRSGDELTRIRDVPSLWNQTGTLMYSRNWLDQQGGGMQYNGAIYGHDTAVGGPPAQDVHFRPKDVNQISIPLYCLGPLFSYGRLLPAMLMSGLRIEIEWNTTENAFISIPHVGVGAGAGPTPQAQWALHSPSLPATFTISNPTFNLCSVQLSDSIQRALNEQSATNGLEIVYTDYEKTNVVSASAQDSVHIEIRKSCSRALKAFARLHAWDNTRVKASRDIYEAEPYFGILEYQWQLGSLYFPQQPVKGASVSQTASIAYAHTLQTVDKYVSGDHAVEYEGRAWNRKGATTNLSEMNDRVTTAASVDEYWNIVRDPNQLYFLNGFGKQGSYLNCNTTIGVTLERSNLFSLAGVPVNNSRVLAFRGRFVPLAKHPVADANPARQREVIIHLKYVKMARVFLNNVEVEQ
jgi:hypothetical protein